MRAMFLVILVFVGGCASTPPPRVAPERTRAKATRGPDGVVLVFTLTAENAGAEALPLQQVSYEVELGGKRVFGGVRSPESTVRRYGRQTFRLPAGVRTEDVPAAGLHPYRVFGTIQYQPPGALADVLFDAEVRRPGTGFEVRGEVEIPGERP